MSKAQLKSLVKASGGHNFIDGVLESVARQSAYGGEQQWYFGIDEINKNASAGLTEIHPTGKHSGYSKMRGSGKKVTVPLHTSGELNQLNPDIGNYKPKYHGYGDSISSLTQGAGLAPGLQGAGFSPGLQGAGEHIIGGFLPALAAMLAPVAVGATVKGIKKIAGKGARNLNAKEKKELAKRVEPKVMPVINGMIAKHSLKLYPPKPGVNDYRFTLADPYPRESVEGGFFGSIVKSVAPAVLPLASKGVTELFKKIKGKGSGHCTCSKKEINGMGKLLLPLINEVASVMIPHTHGSGIGPGLTGGTSVGLTGGTSVGLTGGTSVGLTGVTSAGLTGSGVRVSTGQDLYPGSSVTLGKGKYIKMDPVKKSQQARQKAKSNPWLAHVANVRAENPNLSYKEVLVKAKSSYHQHY